MTLWCQHTSQTQPASKFYSCTRKTNFCVISDSAVWEVFSHWKSNQIFTATASLKKSWPGTYGLGSGSLTTAYKGGCFLLACDDMRRLPVLRAGTTKSHAGTTKSHAAAAKRILWSFLSAAPKHDPKIYRPLSGKGSWRLSRPIPIDKATQRSQRNWPAGKQSVRTEQNQN